jgi:hypothetical protein
MYNDDDDDDDDDDDIVCVDDIRHIAPLERNTPLHMLRLLHSNPSMPWTFSQREHNKERALGGNTN